MKELILQIKRLKKDKISSTVNQRMKEFETVGNKNSNEIFKELCFCLLTANFSAAGGLRIQKEIGDDFLTLSKEDLSKRLTKLRYRFPNVRASYIHEAQKHKDNIKEILESFDDDKKTRAWIVKNIKGIGMKEASHFLRNIGYKNLAIIDFHIVDILEKNNLIERPKTLTPKKYLEVEDVLEELARKTKTNLGELDLYLWYEETGTVLK